MAAVPVSPRVNSPHNDDPSLVEPIDLPDSSEPRQRTLF
jgi:hypothetical protein